MPKSGLLEIVLVVDNSGSMMNAAEETRVSTDEYISSQKYQPGETRLTLAKFANPGKVEWVTKSQKIEDFDGFNEYHPTGGSTALFQSVGEIMTAVGNDFAARDESERPEKVMFVIQTDGQENSSDTRKWPASVVKDMIKHQEEVYKWNVVFLGADMNAYAQSSVIGLSQANSLSYDKGNTKAAYNSLGAYTMGVRGATGPTGASLVGFTQSDRDQHKVK